MGSISARNDVAVAASAGVVGDVWRSYTMALEDVADRLARFTSALRAAGVPCALVGGQAVALWVATKDPAAVRTTKDVDVLLRREDLSRARAAARSAGMDYFETMGVGMFLDERAPNPRHAVHLVWARELVRPGDVVAAPDVTDRTTLPGNYEVVSLSALAEMKLMAYRDQDRVHLRDLIGVGLIGREMLSGLTPELAARLAALLDEQGR